MTSGAKKCPDCQTKLEEVSLADLQVELSQKSADAKPNLSDIVFKHFVFNVCPNCGRTIVYATSKIKKMAAEIRDEILGLG